MFTTGQLIVIGLRLVVPLIIPKRPLLGGILSMLLDALDVVIVEWFGPGGMGPHYHNLDKILDLYYLSFAAWVASRWDERLPRITALGLFAWRLVGVVLFEVTGWRPILFIFANLFEHWYLFYLIRTRWFPGVRLDTWPRVAGWLVVLYIPKALQEYLLHIAEAQPWDWIKHRFGL